MDIVIFGVSLIFLFLLWFFYSKFWGAEYYPTTSRKMKKMLEFAELGESDIAYDLGSGDGRLVIAAARRCRKATGIEIDPARYLIAKLKAAMLGLRNANFVWGNFFHANVSDATVVFLFLRQYTNDKLREKFLTELKKTTRIVSHYWLFTGWKPLKTDEKMKIYLYEIGKSEPKKK